MSANLVPECRELRDEPLRLCMLPAGLQRRRQRVPIQVIQVVVPSRARRAGGLSLGALLGPRRGTREGGGREGGREEE